ncbi:MAG TPA: hypothetical protein VFQ53_02655 [Kofleriaceae bacterium]|nr:hypothetical protein [Kofleriaceae bacterium]
MLVLRSCGVALLAIASACGSSKTDRGASASGSAPPPPSPTPAADAAGAPACIVIDSWHGLRRFVVDGERVTLCSGNRVCPEPALSCVTVELASGRTTLAKPPVEPAATPTYHGRIEKDEHATFCQPDGTCAKLAVPVSAAMIEHEMHIELSPDGRVALVSGEPLRAMYLVDPKSARVTRKITPARDGCFVRAWFLGDTIYARACMAPWPDQLFRANGTVLATYDDVDVGLFDRPVEVGPHQYAVHRKHGDGYLVFDATTGKVIRRVPEPAGDVAATAGDDRSADTRGPLRTSAGKLVLLGREILVSDPSTGTIEQHYPLPVCAVAGPVSKTPPPCP